MRFLNYASLAWCAFLSFSCGNQLPSSSDLPLKSDHFDLSKKGDKSELASADATGEARAIASSEQPKNFYKAYENIGEDLPAFAVHDDLNLMAIPDTFRLNLYRDGYANLWKNISLKNDRIDDIDWYVNVIVRNKERYKYIESKTGVPWYFVGITHGLEATFDFSSHLHNGDPLSRRTYNVPAGRPSSGAAPFSWEFSAIDALNYTGFSNWDDWGEVPILAFAFESYNGFGYRSKGIHSPYLWSFSNQYSRGKYVADGRFDSRAVSAQAGAMSILKRGIDRGVFVVGGSVNLDQKIKSTEQPPLSKVLMQGSARSSEVLLLKMRLHSFGFDAGTLDQNFDSVLREAVMDFQLAKGLIGDGEVGQKTWAKLWPGLNQSSWMKGWSTDAGIDLRAMSQGDCLFRINTKNAASLVSFMKSTTNASSITYGGEAARATMPTLCPDLREVYDLNTGKTSIEEQKDLKLSGVASGQPQSLEVTWHRVAMGPNSEWSISSFNGGTFVTQKLSRSKAEVVSYLTEHFRANNVLGSKNQ